MLFPRKIAVSKIPSGTNYKRIALINFGGLFFGAFFVISNITSKIYTPTTLWLFSAKKFENISPPLAKFKTFLPKNCLCVL